MTSVMAWQQARRFAESNMTATVTITRPDSAIFDTDTGDLDAVTGDKVYEGKARVYTVSGPMSYGLGDENQYYQASYVSVPLEDDLRNPVLPQIDDLIHIDSHHDPLIEGKYYRVTDVEGSGQYVASRRLQVVGAQNSRTWVDTARHPSIPDEWLV